MVTKFPARAPVLDADGQPLRSRPRSTCWACWPGRLADPAATAQDFAGVTKLDAGRCSARSTPRRPPTFLALASLDPGTYAKLRAGCAACPAWSSSSRRSGCSRPRRPGWSARWAARSARCCAPTARSTCPGPRSGLSGLEQAYQRQLLGTPTTEVVAVTAAGTQAGVLASWPARRARRCAPPSARRRRTPPVRAERHVRFGRDRRGSGVHREGPGRGAAPAPAPRRPPTR